VKLDEYGNPIKKKKSKRKENEGSRVEQSPVATHKEPLSDRVRASDDSFCSKEDFDEPHFDDFFIKLNQAKQDSHSLGEVDEWDANAVPTENRKRDDDHDHNSGLKSHQSKSQGTAVTMLSAESDSPPRVTSIDVTRYDVDDISTVGGSMNEYHGEMLHSFLQRSGHNDEVALRTAMAFEMFLKQQQESGFLLQGATQDDASQKSGSNFSHGESTTIDEDSFEKHLENMERVIEQRGDGDSFAISESWDEGSFATLNDHMLSRGAERSKEYTDQSQDDGWGNIRRNETYIRRMSGDGMQPTPPRPRNMVAATQRNMIGAQSYPRNHVPSGLQHLPIVGPPHQMGPPRQMGPSHVMGPPRQMSPPRQMGPPLMMGPPRQMCPPHTMGPAPIIARGNHAGAHSLVRRALSPPRLFEQQMSALSIEQRSCVLQLKNKWESRLNGIAVPFPDLWYIRFAKCSPGSPFHYKSAWIVMKKFDTRYLSLSIIDMECQLLTKTLFPCPGLKSNVGYDSEYLCC
jgi:hypothetical protein